MTAIAPTTSGKKQRTRKPQPEWCSGNGSWVDAKAHPDVEYHDNWIRHYPGRQGFLGLGFHPKTERRLRRAIARRRTTHVRCPECGRRLLASWYPNDAELFPRIPPHKRRP